MAIDDAIEEMRLSHLKLKKSLEKKFNSEFIPNIDYWQNQVLRDYFSRQVINDAQSLNCIYPWFRFNKNMGGIFSVPIYEFMKFIEKRDPVLRFLMNTAVNEGKFDDHIVISYTELRLYKLGKYRNEIEQALHYGELRSVCKDMQDLPFMFSALLIEHGQDFVNLFRNVERNSTKRDLMDNMIIYSDVLKKRDCRSPISLINVCWNDVEYFFKYGKEHGVDRVHDVIHDLGELDTFIEEIRNAPQVGKVIYGMIYDRVKKFNPNLTYEGMKNGN